MEIVGRARPASPSVRAASTVPPSTTPSAAAARASVRSRLRTRSASSPAALRVNVRPSTWSGSTMPLASSQTTRAAMVSVLPEPGTGHDERRPERRLDHDALLGGRRRLPDQGGDLVARGAASCDHLPALAADRARAPHRAAVAQVVGGRLERGRGHLVGHLVDHASAPSWVRRPRGRAAPGSGSPRSHPCRGTRAARRRSSSRRGARRTRRRRPRAGRRRAAGSRRPCSRWAGWHRS